MIQGMQNTSGRLVIYFDPVDDVPRLLTIKGGKGAVLDTIETYSEENSASAAVLNRVAETTRRLFPADSYGLILWSHGMGWLPEKYSFPGARSLQYENRNVLRTKYFGEDRHQGDPTGANFIEIKDLAEALPGGFHFILFDACFMASVEVLYELRTKTDYLIASPAEIISNGFPYDRIMSLLWGEEGDLRQLCVHFFDYYNTHPDPDNEGWQSATVALIKAGELEPLMVTVREVMRGRADFQNPDVWRYPLSRPGELPDVFYDLKDFVNSVATDDQKAAFEKQLSRTVVYKAATPWFFWKPIPAEKYSGLSTYIPLNQWGAMNQKYNAFSWSQAIYH